jgi:hypothetical protein
MGWGESDYAQSEGIALAYTGNQMGKIGQFSIF